MTGLLTSKIFIQRLSTSQKKSCNSRFMTNEVDCRLRGLERLPRRIRVANRFARFPLDRVRSIDGIFHCFCSSRTVPGYRSKFGKRKSLRRDLLIFFYDRAESLVSDSFQQPRDRAVRSGSHIQRPVSKTRSLTWPHSPLRCSLMSTSSDRSPKLGVSPGPTRL